MKPHILITGVPGNVGSAVVEAIDNKSSIRIAAFDVEAVHQAFGSVFDYTHFNFLDPSTFKATFVGIERMFLIRPPALSNVKRDIAPAIHAAINAGVKHIVFLSIQGVENNKIVPHYKIEQLILSTGVDYTFLRAGFFMQNLSTTHSNEIKETGKIALPVGKAKTAFIDARDIGAVAAQTLTETCHKNKIYTLTGREALDYYQIVDIMSSELERTIQYTNPNPLRFFWRQLRHHRKPSYALVTTMLYTITRFGNASQTSSDVEQILGRPPITFSQFVQDHRQCWLPS